VKELLAFEGLLFGIGWLGGWVVGWLVFLANCVVGIYM
jgi:hypothetical protein